MEKDNLEDVRIWENGLGWMMFCTLKARRTKMGVCVVVRLGAFWATMREGRISRLSSIFVLWKERLHAHVLFS